eukprot:TRINITY_DN53694_c0_g1_i2.p1 TRINITY_DN53694_c0_g1~~TRINITY_DN53694_c0_g1_i2.p1  ORF type:complete len:100 (-),score=11.22 TRINITY_DN53694_c0_g1_i2:95-394(-)
MHYVGRLVSNKEVFDSSRAKNRPFKFIVGKGMVIRGWDEGVPQLSLGAQGVLTIGSDYAYGSEGVPDRIPPDADLEFEVELLAIGGKAAGSSGGGCALL